VCVGRKELEEAQRRHPNQTVVHLPNGVDAPRFAVGDGSGFRARRGIPADAFVILVVGRIDPQKNQLLAVRLLSELRRVEPRAHLVLVGPVTNADYDASLSQEISGLGLDANVTLIRGLETSDPDLVNAYHAADLFLLPSVHEPFGIVILEAWAAGLPVVASNVGGVPSFVSDGANGCLFPPGDLPALLGVVRGMIASPDRRRQLAVSGRKKAVDEFGWDRITRRLVGIYEEAIRAHSLRK
jgi:glycosyltransferase involved in cell wall biosynthesis